MAHQHLLHPHGHTEGSIPYSRPGTPRASPPKLGFCGIGAMGKMMARNLANSQRGDTPPVLLFNRTASKAQALVDELGERKVAVAAGLEQMAKECDIIFTCLPSDEVTKDVYTQFSQILKNSQHEKRKIFVEMSTIYPTLAGELDTLMTGPHTFFISAPIFGAPPAAQSAQLVIIMAGEVRAKREVAHILVPAVGRKVIDLGSNVEKGPTMKLIGNSLILGTVELIAEGLTLASKSEVGAENLGILINDLFPSPTWARYTEKILKDEYDASTGFHIDGSIKDASHISTLAKEKNSPMPITDITLQHMLTARALHSAQGQSAKYPQLDMSGLAGGSRIAAGLDPFDSSKHPNKPVDEEPSA
ncbi:hypothetical protein M422DRAFT_25168 [Sphaerobolus stellatus SS14]|nr:hypothetical protein M422DRAFT_25168 [Sphaerobolus stellatus SS14]